MLPARLRQIEIQKGAFRNVTEAGLQEEIKNSSSPSLDDATDKGDEEQEETREERQMKLWNARNEMLKQLE